MYKLWFTDLLKWLFTPQIVTIIGDSSSVTSMQCLKKKQISKMETTPKFRSKPLMMGVMLTIDGKSYLLHYFRYRGMKHVKVV